MNLLQALTIQEPSPQAAGTANCPHVWCCPSHAAMQESLPGPHGPLLREKAPAKPQTTREPRPGRPGFYGSLSPLVGSQLPSLSTSGESWSPPPTLSLLMSVLSAGTQGVFSKSKLVYSFTAALSNDLSFNPSVWRDHSSKS